MDLTIPQPIQKLIEARVKSGQYQSAEDVIAAAVSLLDQQEQSGDFEPGELDRLLAEAEQSGAPLDGEAVFAELRSLSRQKSKAG